MSKMKRHGPDILSSWVIAGACCFINMMMYAMARISGVLFVASVTRFNVSREKASFPYTFDNFMRNTSGPLVGFLGHRYGVRAVTTFGCILGAIGAGSCYFAESIDTVTILWGAIFGLGFGLGSILLPVSINQYFDKHRATASGISYSGACLGSFFLPPIVELLINKYGLSGTYLFLSGFILNCVPAALLLKKPNFDVRNSQISDDCEKQSIVSGIKTKLYTEEDTSSISSTSGNKNVGCPTNPDTSDVQNQQPTLTYKERINRLSTQTLLSEDSIRMSSSEPLDVEQIIENSKGRRQVDRKVLEQDDFSLSSQTTDPDINSEKDEVFEKDVRSSNVQYDTPISPESLSFNRALSSESLPKGLFTNNCNSGYQNYGYQNDLHDFKLKHNVDVTSNFVPQQDLQKRTYSKSSNEIYFKPFEKNMPYLNHAPKKLKALNNSYMSKSFDSSEIDNFRIRHGKLSSLPEKANPNEEKTSPLGSFSIIFDPMFILIAITNAFYCFTFVCMITILIDFSRDLNIGTSNEKYILMTLSVGDLVGRLSLGWITDGGYMTTTAFAALCFACQGITCAATVWSDGFITLMVIVTLYGFSESGIIVIFPIIVSQYIDHDKQTVAIPSSNFLSGPLCLAVAPLIGYFRDNLGAYDYIFYGLGLLSFLCCFSWILAPCVARCRKKH